MMNRFRSRPALALASAAALAMTATPAMARGWHRDRGLDGGDVLAGVLIIGGIAAVAAAASKANREKRERTGDYRYPDRRYPDSRYPDSRYPGDYRTYPDYRDRDGRYGDNRGEDERYGDSWRDGDIDGAVNACVGEVERGQRRVDTVDSVNREADGWRVDGRLEDGRDFSCTADRDARIRRMTVDGRAVI